MNRLDPRLRAGSIENRRELLRVLPQLTLKEQRLVSCVHLLAVMLDGDVSSKEMKTFEEMQRYAPDVWTESIDGRNLRQRLDDLCYMYRDLNSHVRGIDVIRALDPQWTREGDTDAGPHQHAIPEQSCRRRLGEKWTEVTYHLI